MKSSFKLLASSFFVFVFLFTFFSVSVNRGTLAIVGDPSIVRTQLKEKLDEVKEEQNRIRQEIRERQQDASEQATLKREEFRERLEGIKDEGKKLALKRIDLNLGLINAKWVESWNNVLERYSQILVKTESRVEKLKESGVDVSEIESAILEAESVIKSAQEALLAQAEKEYIVDIEDEDNLGTSVSSVVRQFRSDLQETRDSIIQAHKALRDVLLSLSGLDGGDQ